MHLIGVQRAANQMTDAPQQTQTSWWKSPARHWNALLNEREEQVFLILTLLIGALVGLMAVTFILLTERVGTRLYPVGGAAWHRVLIPVVGSLVMGYLLCRYFPDARGSGIPQTKAALYAREGRITAATMFGKFFCTSATLASGRPDSAGRCRNRFGLGQAFGSAPGKSEGPHPGGSCCGHRCCV